MQRFESRRPSQSSVSNAYGIKHPTAVSASESLRSQAKWTHLPFLLLANRHGGAVAPRVLATGKRSINVSADAPPTSLAPRACISGCKSEGLVGNIMDDKKW